MVKQIPPDRPLAGKRLPGGYDEDGNGPGLVETNVMYLYAHAEEWEEPNGNIHLHLMYAGRRVNWQVVRRGSRVCKVPGRCHKARLTRGWPRA